MTTGCQRLRAAVERTPCDRIPIFCNLLDQGAKEVGLSLRDYYSRGEEVARAQLAMRAKYGYDNLWSLFYVGKEAELLGCRRIIFAEDGPPNVGHMVLRTWHDIQHLRVPEDLESHPAFVEPAKCLRILRREAGGRYPICAYLTASLSLPAILMGMEKWIRLLMSGPAEARDQLLEKCCAFFRREAELYRRLGADIILYSDPFASTDLLPLKMVQELALPWMIRDLDGIDPASVVFYCGGARMGAVMAEVKQRTGVSAFYLSPMDDFPAAREGLAGRGLLAGVINDIRLLDWSHEEIRSEVRRIIELGGHQGGFLFGTLVMPFGIPEEKIHTLMEAAKTFGRLPSKALGPHEHE